VQTDVGGQAGAIVLAAGEAARFGSPKLLMPFGNSTVVGCVVETLEQAEVHPIVVVAGAQAQAMADALGSARARVVRNPDPGRGMVSSIRVGLDALPADLGRFLVVLGDQPGLQSSDILHLLRGHRGGKGIAIPTRRGKRGHPVVFDGRYRGDLLSLDDQHTLRDFIHSHADDVAEVEALSDAVLRDIDTHEQYADELRRSLAEQHPRPVR